LEDWFCRVSVRLAAGDDGATGVRVARNGFTTLGAAVAVVGIIAKKASIAMIGAISERRELGRGRRICVSVFRGQSAKHMP
jgi:hypothetical protein